MIKNYLKLGLRNLAKNKISSAINLVSLSLAIGCSLVVFEFIGWGTHMDRFHHKLNDLYVIERTTLKEGNQQVWGDGPAPLGPLLKKDIAQVKNMARVTNENAVIRIGDEVFNEQLSFVDDAFYQMLDFPVKWGNKSQFADPDGIVLTEELSTKLFGDENPVGRSLQLRFDVNGKPLPQTFIVKGVFDTKPDESSWYFSALIPYKTRSGLGLETSGDWTQKANITFIETDPAAAKTIADGIKKYLPLYNEANSADKIAAFQVQPLRGISFHAFYVNNRQFLPMDIKPYVMMVIIALATLLLVYFNYMNIAVASASMRLKEVGVRKVLGSSRWKIVCQFLVENALLCMVAVSAGLLLARFLLLPLFCRAIKVDIGSEQFINLRTYLALAGLVLLSSIGGSLYPAIFMSAARPAAVLKADSRISARSGFRKAMLGFQFMLTFLSFSVSLSFIRKSGQIRKKPWGYQPEQELVVRMPPSASYAAFRDQLSNDPGILAVTGARQPLGEFSTEVPITIGTADQPVNALAVLPGFARQLGIPIIQGRDLDPKYPTDTSQAILVNQGFCRLMHWDNPIGKQVQVRRRKYFVVGETGDFHFESFENPVRPLILMACSPSGVGFTYVKTTTASATAARRLVQQIWKKVNPDQPFDYHFQASVFDNYFDGFLTVGEIIGASAIIMIIISMSGVFGLALIILLRKMKEISVRKVLGAGWKDIAMLINGEFLLALGISAAIGLPLAWMLVKSMFRMIGSEEVVSLIPFAISFGSLLFLILSTVSWHIYKANTANPATFLRNE